MNIPYELLRSVVAVQKYPLLFAGISGAHLYGFPSPDSDYDLRGVHILPVRAVITLDEPEETVNFSGDQNGIELDLVTHDVKKFLQLLLKPNGYVLEQLHSPLIIHTTPEHEELRALTPQLITRHHAHHYFGFSRTQWGLFIKENPHRVKPLLYVYRVLLTGIYLMQTGQIEANLLTLNRHFKLPYIEDLIARKIEGKEKSVLDNADLDFHQGEFDRLTKQLEEAQTKTNLPEKPDCYSAINDLLARVRLAVK